MGRALRGVQLNAQDQPFLPYGRQLIEDDDIAAVTAVLRGDFLTTGPSVRLFEEKLGQAVGARHAVVCANGTAALHMAARALDLGPGCKIVVPSITFLATASAPHLNGAEIVFADVDPHTGLMGPEELTAAIARVGRVDAVFNVHLNGQCGALEEIAAVARGHGAKIVDDACHALGTQYISRDGATTPIGANAHCDLTVFSFHPVKTIAMGEGGAVTTNDPQIAVRLERARGHGMVREAGEFLNTDDAFDGDRAPNPWYYEMGTPQFNWRANDIQCALGVSQLAKLERFVARRRALTAHYDHLLSELSPLMMPLGRTKNCLAAWHLYVARMDFEAIGFSRAQMMRELAAQGIGTQVHYYPVHRQPYYARRYETPRLAGADAYYSRALSLPLFAAMTDEDVTRVVAALGRSLNA